MSVSPKKSQISHQAQIAAAPSDGSADEWSVRTLAPEDPDYEIALHLAVVGQPTARYSRRHPAVIEFLADAAAGPTCVEFVLGGYRAGRILTSALALVSPGGSGLVFFPHGSQHDVALTGTAAALRSLVNSAQARGVHLLEALVPPEVKGATEALRQGGFRHLTELIYLFRSTDSLKNADPQPHYDAQVRWEHFDDQSAGLFVEAVRRSYVQSLDCPELTAIRTAEQAVADHRAAGVYDPSLWFVATRRGEPVGVLLLSRMRKQPSIEIVYMGVAQPERGTGVADAMMQLALASARTAGATSLALAADVRNLPARAFYRRWGFAEVGRRSAWIATPIHSGS